MAPTHTVTAHLCKQFYTSWRQTRQPDAANASSPPTPGTAFQFRRAPSPEAKRSMDSDRGSDAGSPPISRQPSNSSWKTWR